MKNTVRVTVTGAAGQISYSLLFRIASGDMLGADQSVTLQLLDIPPAMDALSGVVMELEDCAFPTLTSIIATDNAEIAFGDAEFVLMVGARPRGPGMERKDLLQANAAGYLPHKELYWMKMRTEMFSSFGCWKPCKYQCIDYGKQGSTFGCFTDYGNDPP